MSGFTPTTDQMRMVYITEGAHLPAAKAYDHAEAGAEFDRWLDQVKSEAWDEAADHLEYRHSHAAAYELLLANPYRKEDD